MVTWLFQPMGALIFHCVVNLRWNFLYRTGSRHGALHACTCMAIRDSSVKKFNRALSNAFYETTSHSIQIVLYCLLSIDINVLSHCQLSKECVHAPCRVRQSKRSLYICLWYQHFKRSCSQAQSIPLSTIESQQLSKN